MPCRKDFMDLTAIERDRLADGLNQLYADGLITNFANLHDSSWNYIHWEPQFLPWHRHFLLRLENALQAVDARITLPYWDWTRSDSRDLETGVWGSFFGGRDNTGGRFDHWDITRASAAVRSLPSIGEVGAVLDAASFTDFREGVEPGEVHVAGHVWVGGDMNSPQSPRDPLFYLHHCNIDRIWAVWQLNHSGVSQYDTTKIDSDDNSPGAPVALSDPMVGGATPQSMLDHRALGVEYPLDDGIAAIRPAIVTGDEVSVQLLTPTVWFNDIPEDEETRRPATFLVNGCDRLNFEVTAGPTSPFQLHDSGFVSHPQTDLHTSHVRIWVRYKGTTDGSTDSGSMTVRVTDMDGTEVAQFVDIPLEANTVKRPQAAVVMVLDESGSMLYDAGNNRSRLEVLQRAALTFVDNLYDDNGVALVSFDESAAKLTELVEAGGMASGVRNDARQAIRDHGPPDNKPHTSIGAGIEKATEVYAAAPNAGDFEVKATLVFTDGVQDRQPWIHEVSAAVPDRVYAVGVANAANVANDVLQQLASGSGGMMLVTGAIHEDDEFLLEKFFIQILAGVINSQMVTDPPGVLRFGEIDAVDFDIARTDIGFDALVLTRYPGVVLAGLRAPDGTVLLGSDLPPGSLRVGSSSLDFRMTLPVVHDGVEHWEGEWKLLMTIGGRRQHARTVEALNPEVLGSAALPYHALVHARSNLRMSVSLDQDGLEPGSVFTLTAIVNEYGRPIETHPSLRAVATRPDRTSTTVQLTEVETGRYVVEVPGSLAGPYRFRVIAEGFTTAGERFTREQLVTGVLGRATPQPPEDPAAAVGEGIKELVCELLDCIGDALSPELRKRLIASGVDVETFERCLCGTRERFRPEDLARILASQKRSPG